MSLLVPPRLGSAALIALCTSCAWITDAEHASRIDYDGDGAIAYGYPEGVDCDDYDSSVTGLTTYYRDADGDGAGDPDNPTEDCDQPEGSVENALDCDDRSAAIHPDAAEVCGDGLDNNCDAQACLRSGEWALPDGIEIIGERSSDQAGAALDIWVNGALQPRFAISAPRVAPQGAVYVVFGTQSEDSSLEQAAWRVLGDTEEEFGSAVTWMGADGDTANLLLGVPARDHNGQVDCGAVLLFADPQEGSVSPGDADYLLVGEDDSDQLGTTVTSIGDLDGDGADEAVAGAPGHRIFVPFESVAGGYYLITGADRGERLAFDASGLIEGISEASTGFAAPVMGDFAGDGTRYLAMPARRGDTGSGAVYLTVPELGAIQAIDEGNIVLQGSGGLEQAFGLTLGVGDLDGDARDDLVVAAPGDAVAGQANTGKVYVFLGPILDGSTEMDASAVISGEIQGGRMGEQLMVSADLDGSGGLDLVIAAPGQGDAPGSVYVYLTPTEGTLAPDDAYSEILGPSDKSSLGTSLHAGLDLNGDGLPDLALGAPGTDNGTVFLLPAGPL